MRAVIVGAGIAGLAAAQGLRLIGWDVAVYEQAEKLEPLGAGLSLSANALRALRALGLYDAVVAEAQPIRRLDLLDQRGKVLQTTNFEEFSRRYGHLAMAVLHRGDLHKGLLSKLQDRIIRTGMECVGAREAGDRIVLHFANGDAVEAEFVLACDGIHSAVRKALFPESREHFARYTCWRAISPGVPRGMDPARLSESWGAGKRFGLAAIPADRVYWFACCGAGRTDDPGLAKLDLEGVGALFADFHEPVPEVLGRTAPDSLIWTDILDLDPMPFVHARQGRAARRCGPRGNPRPRPGSRSRHRGRCRPCRVACTPPNGAGAAGIQRPPGRPCPPDSTRIPPLCAGRSRRNPLVVPLRNFLVSSIPERFLDRQLDAVLDVAFDPIRTAA